MADVSAHHRRSACRSGRGRRRQRPAVADILRATQARINRHCTSARGCISSKRSAIARAAQRDTLGDVRRSPASSSSATLPDSFEGVLIANELLDAMPVHQVVMREDGLREVYVDCDGGDAASTREGPLSTPRLAQYFDAIWASRSSRDGARRSAWRRSTGSARPARRLRAGSLILIDYGHEARELYSVTHSAGTLTSYSRHTSAGPETRATVPRPGCRPGRAGSDRARGLHERPARGRDAKAARHWDSSTRRTS